ncbi:MAG: permease-like cell division protein FtsX [Sutterella wadsworthensis]|jgi:cell-division protein ftsX|nr:permease-like cell division protein FtsX [Sutterella wadsworthensis]
MSYISSRHWAFVETFRGLKQSLGLFSLATLLASLALSVPLFISTIFYELAEPLRQLPTAVEITIFTDKNADTAKVTTQLEQFSKIDFVLLIPKSEALAKLNDHLGIKNTSKEHNPLPDILIATVSQTSSATEVQQLADAIEKIDGVDIIAYETDWRLKLDALSQTFKLGILCLGIVIATLVLLVVATAIRMTTLTIQPQMRALYLFGASPSFAIRPIAWRGTLLMLIASLGALGITQVGLQTLQHQVATLAQLYNVTLFLEMPAMKWCLSFIIGCSVIGYLVATLSAQDAWRKIQY